MKENKKKFNFCACFNCYRQDLKHTYVKHYLHKENGEYFCGQIPSDGYNIGENKPILACLFVNIDGKPYETSSISRQFKVITGLIKFNQENEK